MKNLELILLRMKRVLIAFSAGVDSTLLLKVASDCLGAEVLAVTATSPTYPLRELKQARQIAAQLGVRLKIIRTQELRNPKFANNPSSRCYYCKKELFQSLRQIAAKEKIKYILDGSNLDDRKDFRPGNKAKRQLRVRSPLAEAKLSKGEIRKISRALCLATWNKPALACLASRIAYGRKISHSTLRRIEKGEEILRKLGFSQVRLRHYDGLARIEVEKKRIKRLLKPAVMESVVDRFRELGYNYVTLDLEGYRRGSMNERRP